MTNFMASRKFNKMKIALIQMKVSEDKIKNLIVASDLINKASKQGSELIALPECFNSPYGNKYFAQYAESIPGQSSNQMAEIAKRNKIHLLAGSIPEKEGNCLYNTSLVFDSEGSMIAKFRKIHLFDIDIPGKIKFKESETLKPGNSLSVFSIGDIKIGLGICYDIRFAEMAIAYRKMGCHLLLYPGAFNMTTGPVHWELLIRARALDNQLYCAAISPALNDESEYKAWGHSTIVDPWGKVIACAKQEQEIIYGEIDPNYITEVRTQIPITKQCRPSIYQTTQAQQ